MPTSPAEVVNDAVYWTKRLIVAPGFTVPTLQVIVYVAVLAVGYAGWTAPQSLLVAASATGAPERLAAGSEAREEEAEHLGLVERILDMVRDRPVTAFSAALAAGLLLIRNPSVAGVVLRTVLEAWPGPEVASRRRSRR